MASYGTSTAQIVFFVLINASKAAIRYHEDGSMSSNSGPTFPLQRFISRTKRTSFYINSEPRFTSSAGSISAEQADLIVSEHNRLRRLLPSSNMQALVWDSNLAAAAQAHANLCVFQHSPSPRENGNGENIFAAPFPDVGGAVNMWFNEANVCGCYNGYKECCGHYSQVVWAATNKIGCGLANCGNIFYAPGQRYILVCQYNPGGNILDSLPDGSLQSYAAFNVRKTSDPLCSECPAGSYCNNGLCDVK